MIEKVSASSFDGFSKLNRVARLNKLKENGLLNVSDIALLEETIASDMINLAETFSENVLGCFPFPFGVVPCFPLNEKLYTIPMVIEETSVVAAVSKMAKWIRQSGEISAQQYGQEIIGQIQFARVKNFTAFKEKIEKETAEWIALANDQIVPNLVRRGGGVTRLAVREILRNDGHTMAVVHVYMNPCNAMGANLINQVCEFLRLPISLATHEVASMCILTNLVDTKLTEATITLHNVDLALGEKIVEAALFAAHDPYRAATHNKGVMNGMDAVLIATGNDWRAVEAGAHAYAARSGQYRGLTEWQLNGRDLVGKIVAPVVVGTVGGVTRLHPFAALSLRLLNVTQADELSKIVAAVGLVQNLAALRALSEEGIVSGHMKLHLTNLLLAVGATKEEEQILRPIAEQYLKERHKVTESDVIALLTKWREEN